MKQPFPPRRLLLPLVPLYGLALGVREMRLKRGGEPVQRLRFPVVSIGNLSTGGTGKTPLAIALAHALLRRGLHVDILSRGYRRQGQHAVRVDPKGTAEQFGDEPLLMGLDADVPVYVADNRYDAGLLAEWDAAAIAALAEEKKPTVHLLDDGFQHRQLHRDVDILLLNRQDWEDRLLPAGNLREPLRAARRAGVIAIPAEDLELETELKAWGWGGPVWGLWRMIEAPPTDGPVAAFCGIARPDQFFTGIEAAGLQLAARFAFPDHHRYTARDLDRVVSKARAAGATALLTTEKDRVRLGGLIAGLTRALPLKTVRLQVEIDREGEAIDWILARLDLALPQPPL